MSRVDLHGSCLCGDVAYRVSGELKAFFHCHCQRCRKATGSAHASNILVGTNSVNWTQGADRVRRYDVPGAKRFATVFCAGCGSYLPRLSAEYELVAVPAGSLDHEPGLKPDARIFTASRTSWSCMDDLPCYDEYPRQ